MSLRYGLVELASGELFRIHDEVPPFKKYGRVVRPRDHYRMPDGRRVNLLKVSDHDWLAEEWSPNNEVDASEVMLKSIYEYLWVCKVCKIEWTDVPRTRFEKARNCKNDCVPSWFDPISITHPDLAKRLTGDNPDLVFFSDTHLYEWACTGHVFMSRPNQVSTRLARCKMCSGSSGRQTAMLKDHDTFQHVDPDWVEFASLQSISSKENINWICDEGHSFSRRITRYIRENQSCSTCKGRNAGSLADRFPDVAAEWSPENELSPSEVSAFCWNFAKWVCAHCEHKWSASVANRTSKSSGCPECWKRRGATSLIEQELLRLIQHELNEDLRNSAHIEHEGRWVFADMLTSDLIAVEYDSKYWHAERLERDIERIAIMEGSGHRVISIREVGLDLLEPHDLVFDPKIESLSSLANRVVERIKNLRVAR